MTTYRVVFTDDARLSLRRLDGAERLVNISPGALSREAMRALLAGTTLGGLLEDLATLAGDPYGGPTIARAGAEDDRIGLLGSLAVTYMVSSATEPPVITVTAVMPPKV